MAIPAPDGEHWVTVESFRDLSAAIVARSALEAEEIPCFLRDENTVRMDWTISNFIGGMRLQVLEEDVEAAKTVLAGLVIEDLPTGEDTGEFLDKCPNCGNTDISRERKSRGLSLASLVFFSLPLPRGKQVWTCAQCGTEWKDED